MGYVVLLCLCRHISHHSSEPPRRPPAWTGSASFGFHGTYETARSRHLLWLITRTLFK